MTHLARPTAARRPASRLRRGVFIRHSAIGNRHCQGFTFIEILFAIIILGVGMIMIAGMLPVAIKQNSDTRDDVVAQAVCDAGYANLLVALQTADLANAFQATGVVGTVEPLDDKTVRGAGYADLSNLRASRISSTDPRFRWLGFYRRDANSSFVKLIILGLRIHNTDAAGTSLQQFTANSMLLEGDNKGNGPFKAVVNLVEGDEPADNVFEPDRIEFVGEQTNGNDRDNWDLSVAATGAFVIVSDVPSDANPNGDTSRSARNNGRVFRLASQRIDLDSSGRTWDLAGGYDLAPLAAGPDGIFGTSDDLPDHSMYDPQIGALRDTTRKYSLGTKNNLDGKSAKVWLVGRGRTNPLAPVENEVFSGLAQDVAVLQVNVLMQQ